LLTLFASGGTFEHTVGELPMFKAQIESAFDWLKTAGRCSTAEVEAKANSLRELTLQKDEAMRRCDFDLAARARAQECVLLKSFGLRAPTGETWNTIMRVGVAEQIRSLSEMFNEENAA
jgi:hypothetical protein